MKSNLPPPTRPTRLSGLMGPRLLLALASLAATGCGDSGYDDDGGAPPDAMPGFCWLSLSLPEDPATDRELVMSGVFHRDGGEVLGLESLTWRVTLEDGRELTTSPYGTVEHAVQVVTVDTPGIYRVELSGTIGDVACDSTIDKLNVRHWRAETVAYRLRAVPPAGRDAPAQERDLVVYGGANAFITDWELSGRRADGRVRTDSDQGASAYLRFTTPGHPQVEAFADSNGWFSVPLLTAPAYRVLVIPQSPDLAPLRLPPTAVNQLDEIVIDGGQIIDGTVLDGLGAPVVGARVTLDIADVPTTMAHTDEQGRFSVRTGVAAPGSQPLAASVVPPESSGLPATELSAASGLTANDSLTIRYASALTSRSVSVPVRQLDGTTPAAGARVTLHSRPIASAATIDIGGQNADMEGSMRFSGVVGGDGMSPSVLLPEALYDVVVEPASADSGQGVAIEVVDLRAGQPTPPSLSLAPKSRLLGHFRAAPEPDGPPLEGVEVVARPLDLLANATSASASDATGDGSFALSVAGGVRYRLTASMRDDDFARVVATVESPAAGQELDMGALPMLPTLEIRGSVALPGSTTGTEGVHLMLMCYDCTGVDALRPIAEVVSSTSGDFVLHVPDPGLRASGS